MLDAIQSEYSVIGAICANPVEARRLNLTADDFTSDAAARVFSEAVANKDFDAVVAMNVLSTALGAEQARKFITSCMDLCPTSALLQARAKEVRDAALNRRLRDDATAALEELDGVELADRLAAISRQHLQHEQGNAVSLTKALTDYMQGLERENADRLNTGFYRLDGILKGMRPGQLIVLGARPAVGKSAFLLNVALQVARVGKVVLFTMEMSSKELVQRAIAASSKATLDDLLDGEVNGQIIKKIVDPIGSLSSLPIIIDDRPGLTVQQVSARARLHPDARLIIVDYLGLMRTRKGETRSAELGELSRALKKLAVELGVPIIAAQQLNRRTDDTERPSLLSIRDSGQIEADANAVLLMWRSASGLIAIDIAKNRMGRTGVVQFEFDGEHMRFKESPMRYEGEPPKRRGFM